MESPLLVTTTVCRDSIFWLVQKFHVLWPINYFGQWGLKPKPSMSLLMLCFLLVCFPPAASFNWFYILCSAKAIGSSNTWFYFLQKLLACHSNKQGHQSQLLQVLFLYLCSCTQNMLQMIHNALDWECWSMARRQPSIMDSPFPLMMMASPIVETEIKQLLPLNLNLHSVLLPKPLKKYWHHGKSTL